MRQTRMLQRMSSPRRSTVAPRIVADDSGNVVLLRRHPRARRYAMRLNREGQIVVTIPRGGNRRAAMTFVSEHRAWIERHQAERSRVSSNAAEWRSGTMIFFRGRLQTLGIGHWFGRPVVEFDDQRVFIADPQMNLRRPVEERLRELARHELTARTLELAAKLKIRICAVTVRNQSSRWGSCSERGEISLNWRLVQAPASVRDYIVIHELMHRRQMNHSIRFWRLVAVACPDWRQSEDWLKRHALELGF